MPDRKLAYNRTTIIIKQTIRVDRKHTDLN